MYTYVYELKNDITSFYAAQNARKCFNPCPADRSYTLPLQTV